MEVLFFYAKGLFLFLEQFSILRKIFFIKKNMKELRNNQTFASGEEFGRRQTIVLTSNSEWISISMPQETFLWYRYYLWLNLFCTFFYSQIHLELTTSFSTFRLNFRSSLFFIIYFFSTYLAILALFSYTIAF